jgi:hypothetical protein
VKDGVQISGSLWQYIIFMTVVVVLTVILAGYETRKRERASPTERCSQACNNTRMVRWNERDGCVCAEK